MSEGRMLPLSEILREDASAEDLEQALSQLSEAERFALDKALKTVGGAAQTALPGVMQGASQGAAFGPYGMLVGGAVGGVQSLLGGGAKPAPSRPPRPAQAAMPMPTTVGTPAVPFRPGVVPPTAAAPPLGGSPAAQLLMAVQDPRTLQALASLVAGSAGRQEIPVGQTSAPPTAFLNLLQALSAQAAAGAATSAATSSESTHSYLRGADGEYEWDVASPEARAQALLSQLHRVPETAGSPVSTRSAGDWLLESGLAEVIPTFH